MIQDNLHLPENLIENSYMPGASEERWKKRGYQKLHWLAIDGYPSNRSSFAKVTSK